MMRDISHLTAHGYKLAYLDECDQNLAPTTMIFRNKAIFRTLTDSISESYLGSRKGAFK
jgi:hypothetical protein